MKIVVDDLASDPVARFLEEHMRDMRSVSPPESTHALDLAGLRNPSITFWSVLDGETIVGCGALKALDAQHGELKSMRTAASHRSQGIGALMVQHIIDEARRRDYCRLYLETGSMPFFAPARRLYARFGFVQCPPFADYKDDPNSVFMTLAL